MEKRFFSVIFIPFFIGLIICPIALAAIVIVSPGQAFGLPAYGTYIYFTKNCTLDASSFREGGSSWHFNNLNFDGVTSSFVVSTIDSNINIKFVDFNSWLNYTTTKAGTQTFTSTIRPSIVCIDAVKRYENDGWSYATGIVTIVGAQSSVDIYYFPSSTPIPTPFPTTTPTIKPTSTITPIPTSTLVQETQSPNLSPVVAPTPSPTSTYVPSLTPTLYTPPPTETPLSSPVAPLTPIPSQLFNNLTLISPSSALPTPSAIESFSPSQSPLQGSDQTISLWIISAVVIGFAFTGILVFGLRRNS